MLIHLTIKNIQTSNSSSITIKYNLNNYVEICKCIYEILLLLIPSESVKTKREPCISSMPSLFQTGTEIHEAIHRYSSRNVVENIGFNFNEGLTEYFTRIVTADRIERGDEYYYQLLLIELLVDKSILSVADLGDMYFNGAADRLLTQLTAKLDPSFRYSAFISLVNASRVADARGVRSQQGQRVQRTHRGRGISEIRAEGKV